MSLTKQDLEQLRNDIAKDRKKEQTQLRREIAEDRRMEQEQLRREIAEDRGLMLTNYVIRPEFEELKLEMREGFADIRDRITVLQDVVIGIDKTLKEYMAFNDAKVNDLDMRVLVLESS